jgi:hypothetical protein
VETLAALGEITALYPEKWICDVAGFPRIVGRDLIDNLVADARQYDPAVCTGETVERLIRHDDGMLRLATSRGGHDTRVLLITAGIGAFRPKTFLGSRRSTGTRAKGSTISSNAFAISPEACPDRSGRCVRGRRYRTVFRKGEAAPMTFTPRRSWRA